MSNIRRADSHRSLERKQWAQLDRYRKSMKLVGRGEGYVKEIYFGRGFSAPPAFSYSAVFNQEEVPIKPWYLVPPRNAERTGVDQYGMGNDSFGPNGMIHDPSFELQGKWRHVSSSSGWDTIPDVYDQTMAIYDFEYGSGTYANALFPIASHIESNTYTNDYAPRYPQYGASDYFDGHRWLQTGETRDKWSVTTADSHDLGTGHAGSVSAVSTIGPDGYTNWLLPFDWSWPYYSMVVTPENAWRSWRSSTEATGTTNSAAYGGGPWMQAYPPPYIEGFEGFGYVKCTNDVELQVNATFHIENYGYEGDRGTRVFPDSDYNWGDSSDTGFGYRELASVDFEQLVRGGDWARVDIGLPYAGWRSWPDVPTCLQDKGEPDDPLYWNFRYRVKGTPGDTVYLDNLYLTRKMRNAEIPMLTIGVDEWIRDDAGVYIGARLWVVMGEPTKEPCS